MASAKEIKEAVKARYTAVAESRNTGCGCGDSGCGCGSEESSCCGGADPKQAAAMIGYNFKDLEEIPQEAILGLGCGSPVGYVGLKAGEIVLDLGSGGGIDVFLAAKKVGSKGKVYGVDMNEAMIRRAKEAAVEYGFDNVEFRLGEIEQMPIDDGTIDAIISNCVINLSPNKQRVFNEAFRVLKPGGRLMISDMVLLNELPDAVKESVQAYVGCISGAEMKSAYTGMIEKAGFKQVKILEETHLPLELMLSDATAKAMMKELDLTEKRAEELINSVISIKLSAIKPHT